MSSLFVNNSYFLTLISFRVHDINRLENNKFLKIKYFEECHRVARSIYLYFISLAGNHVGWSNARIFPMFDTKQPCQKSNVTVQHFLRKNIVLLFTKISGIIILSYVNLYVNKHRNKVKYIKINILCWDYIIKFVSESHSFRFLKKANPNLT